LALLIGALLLLRLALLRFGLALLVVSAPPVLTLLLLLLSLSLLCFSLALLVACTALILTRLLCLRLLLVIPPAAIFLPLLVAPTTLRVSRGASSKQRHHRDDKQQCELLKIRFHGSP
jgi:hypothetical protein